MDSLQKILEIWYVERLPLLRHSATKSTKFHTTDLNKCELLCEADGYAFFDRLAAQVVDGTSCDEESNDVCIAGQCVVSIPAIFISNSYGEQYI